MREPWWRSGVVYQVYPRSFQDSDGDGIGDLEGIRSRLDHLSWLGADAIWLCPVYPSPMADFGYDVSDHRDIDPSFGTLDDLDRLLADAHTRGIKVVMDLVPNHTSVEHPWFTHRPDLYVWRDRPNNWISTFGGSTWTRRGDRYYLHSFLPEQPDLDWRNPAVRTEFESIMRFWLDRGVDGFRVDVIYRLGKDPAFRDDPGGDTYETQTHRYDRDGPLGIEVARWMRGVLDGYPGDRVGIGETTLRDPVRVAAYYADGEGLHLNFNFALCWAPWDPSAVAAAIEASEATLPPGTQAAWCLSNHDVPRHAPSPQAAVLLLTLRGTPCLYYGEEIGMTGCTLARPLDMWGRDPCRTPMRWTSAPNGGFCPDGLEPWLPVCDGPSVEDGPPLLALYRDLIALRRAQPSLHAGAYRTIDVRDGVLSYEREAPDAPPVRVDIAFDDGPAEPPTGWRPVIQRRGVCVSLP